MRLTRRISKTPTFTYRCRKMKNKIVLPPPSGFLGIPSASRLQCEKLWLESNIKGMRCDVTGYEQERQQAQKLQEDYDKNFEGADREVQAIEGHGFRKGDVEWFERAREKDKWETCRVFQRPVIDNLTNRIVSTNKIVQQLEQELSKVQYRLAHQKGEN